MLIWWYVKLPLGFKGLMGLTTCAANGFAEMYVNWKREEDRNVCGTDSTIKASVMCMDNDDPLKQCYELEDRNLDPCKCQKLG
jgi:hypothetical protein